MSSRGRGRPPSRSAQESAAGPSRRSTRQQHQQHQNTTEHEGLEPQPHPDLRLLQEEQQQQQAGQQYQQLDQQEPQLEAPMSAPGYQIIDPAITEPYDAAMPPPPVPSAKNLRGQTTPHAARRYTRRDVRAPSSMTSINSVAPTDAYSSQPEPYSAVPQKSPGRVFGTPMRAISTAPSEVIEPPSRKVGRAKLMHRMLPRFFTASDDLFAHLSIETADPETWDTERRGFKNIFDAYRTHYVSDISQPVVDPAFVVDTMRYDGASSLSSSVFKIVSAANLTSLLDEISTLHDRLPLLQVWDSTFPEYFVPEDHKNDRETNEQILDQALMIRTHLSLCTLQKLQESPTPFHPFEQVARIWCDGVVSAEAVEAFLGDNKDALQLKLIPGMDHPETATLARDRIVGRFRAICSLLHNQPTQDEIDDIYPFDEFVNNLRDFVRAYFAKIKASLWQGSSAVQDSLPFPPSEATSRADSQIRSQLEAETRAHPFDRAESGGPSVSYNMDDLRRLKQMEQPLPYGDGHQLPPGTSFPAPRIPYPPGFGSPAPTGSLYAESANQVSSQPDGSAYAESAGRASGRKRRSQDDGAAGSGPPPAKKTRQRRKKNDVPNPSAASTDGAVSAANAAVSVVRSQYPPLPGSRDEPDLEALTQRTKEISAATRRNKEPQVRSAWVRNDVHLLIAAVKTFACKWSTIEKEIKAGTIPFHRPRDQQALRDKARLLKQDFLKADVLLPAGFDLVVLGKKEREAVRGCGKNPDRKEEDVDENGQPINTELDEEGVLAPISSSIQAPIPEPQPAPFPQAELQPESQPDSQLESSQPEPQPESQPAVSEPVAV